MESIANKHPHLSSFQLRFKHGILSPDSTLWSLQKIAKITGLEWSLKCAGWCRFFHFRFSNFKRWIFKVVVNGVRYLLDRCGFVPAMLFVIVMSSFHHAQCMKQKISFINWYNPEGGLYSKHAAWCNYYLSKIMKGFTKKIKLKKLWSIYI